MGKQLQTNKQKNKKQPNNKTTILMRYLIAILFQTLRRLRTLRGPVWRELYRLHEGHGSVSHGFQTAVSGKLQR